MTDNPENELELNPEAVISAALRSSTLRLYDPGKVPLDSLLTTFSMLGWDRTDLLPALEKLGVPYTGCHALYDEKIGPFTEWDEAVMCLLSERLYDSLARVRETLSIETVITRSLG